MKPLKNTKNRYGSVAIFFHWVMAFLIIGLLALGIYMVQMPISLQKLKYYGWHKEFGMLALMLVIVRLTWRLRNINPSLKTLPKLEEIAARIVHWAFYFFMFLLPISGWLITSAAGLPVSFFGLFVIPNIIAPNESQLLLFAFIHQWLGYALIALICLHVSAALKHYFINKDDIMQRIL